MGNLIKLSFWFNSRPGELLPFMFWFFVGLVILLVAAGIAGVVMKKRVPKSIYRKSRDRIITFSFTNAVLGSILIFFTSERIPFLSARFWFLLWFLVMAAWKLNILKQLREIPKIREQQLEEKKYKQYIP